MFRKYDIGGDGTISFEEFKKAALNPKESVQWYARHLMWQFASTTVQEESGTVLESLGHAGRVGVLG